jgi:hypothetical protein
MHRRFGIGLCLTFFALAALAEGPSNMASTDLMVPSAGRGPGAKGSFWVTDLWIRCPDGGDVVLEFHGLDAATASPLATATIPMTQPVVYLADVVRNVFGLESAFGNIRIRTTRPATATIRVYSAGGGGSYGMAFMAMPVSMGMGPSPMMGGDDEFRYYVQGLLPQPVARVNVMVMNTGATPISGAVEVFDADGAAPATGPASYRFSIQPYSGHQFNDVLAGVRSRFSGDTGLQLRIELDERTAGMMMVLATVTDNATNDGYAVMGSMMDADGPMGMGR